MKPKFNFSLIFACLFSLAAVTFFIIGIVGFVL